MMETHNEQLIYEIAGERYILIEVPFKSDKFDQSQAFCKRHEMVFQGLKEVRQSWWGNGYQIHKMLLPERNFIAYSKDTLE